MKHDEQKHPAGLYVLSGTELWERFSFYSVQSMLALYLRDVFHYTAEESVPVVSTYTALVYASPLIGGFLADRFLGYKASILIGGAFFMLGHCLFAVPGLHWVYVSLACLIIGNGFFKGNIATMVGNLYSTASPLKDRAFSIFYMGINVGAMLGPMACEYLKGRYGFERAFNTAAAGMAVGMLVFFAFQRHVTVAAARPSDTNNSSMENRHPVELVPERDRIIALVLLCSLGVVFWMIFWQNSTTLTFWADENTDWNVSGIISNAINPAFIILFGFAFSPLFKWLNARGLEPSTPVKMTAGLFLASASTAVLYIASLAGGDTGKVSPAWLITAYALISAGEVLLSAMGLSLVSKVAPPRFRGLLTGMWYLSISLGAKLSIIGSKWNEWSHSTFFEVLTVIGLATTVVMILLLRFIRRSMPSI